MEDAFSFNPELALIEGHINALVRLTTLALEQGALADALSLSDRGVRVAPDDYHLRVLRGSVLLRARLPGQAIEEFRRAVALGGGPEGEVGLAHAHLNLGDIRAATDLARAILGRFSCEDFTAIDSLLRRLCNASAAPGAGWAAISPDGKLIGAIRETILTADGRLTVTDGGSGKVLLRKSSAQLAGRDGLRAIDGFLPFALKLREADTSRTIQVSFDGVDLIGSPARAPAANLVEGFVEKSGDRIAGWVAMPGYPRARLAIRVIDQSGEAVDFATDAGQAEAPSSGQPAERQHFAIDIRQLGPDSTRLEIWGWLPALSIGAQLSGSPIDDEAVAGRTDISGGLRTGGRRRRQAKQRSVDVVIPVYDGRAETLACLQSVIAAQALSRKAGDPYDIVVVNDESPDPELVAALTRLADSGEITLLQNVRNAGFPISVNLGIALHSDRDIVALNSDTLVFSDWLSRLRKAAYSAADIGTVTPFLNEGTILSYPRKFGGNPAPSPEDGDLLDGLARSINAGMTVEIPTAVGFCMYLRRDCLDAIGVLDVRNYGRGYSEEEDLCARAYKAGWRSIAAPNVFVTHIGGRSFGLSKRQLVERNAKVLSRRHTGYDDRFAAFIAADPLAAPRRNLDIARLRNSIAGPAVLLVTQYRPGGVNRKVRDAVKRHAANGVKALILSPSRESPGTVASTILADPSDDSLCNVIFDLPAELEALLALMADCRVGGVEIHHFNGLDPCVLTIADRLSAPFDIVIHDYSWLCSRLNLTDGRGQYCGMPADAAVCARCVAIEGSRLAEDIAPRTLRRRSVGLLTAAARVVAPSQDVADRYASFASAAEFKIVPWEQPPLFEKAPAPRLNHGRTRVAVIGSISQQRGYDILLACAQDAALRDLAIEFVVIGHTHDDLRLFKTGRVFVTGRYDEGEAAALVRAQSCHFAFLPSRRPETWSYALTVAWQAGLEVLAFDLGTIAERIRQSGFGHVIPLTTDERAINLAIANFSRDSQYYPLTRLGVALGGTEYRASGVVGRKLGGEPAMVWTEGFSDIALPAHEILIVLEPGTYVFSVRSLEGEADPRPLPIVQIALVGIYDASVTADFMGRHGPVENWLIDQGDVVAVRIAGGKCSLSIKCLRIFGVESRPISVEGRSLVSASDATRESSGPVCSELPRLQITAHIRNRGDLIFVTPGWAGCVDEHFWIEAFTIEPIGGIARNDLEYCGITGAGIETPWLPGGMMCGTRGASTPLMAFAVRLRGAAAARFECRYSGSFQAAGIVGPFRDGGVCRSPHSDDPLEGIALEIVEKTAQDLVADAVISEPAVPDYEIVFGSY